jgi:hypothetical protein
VSTFFAIKGLASQPTDTAEDLIIEDLTICGFLFHCRCSHCGCGPYTHGQSKWFCLHSFCHDIRFHSHSRYVLGAQWVSFAYQMGEPHLNSHEQISNASCCFICTASPFAHGVCGAVSITLQEQKVLCQKD